jgi:hypothetical protein
MPPLIQECSALNSHFEKTKRKLSRFASKKQLSRTVHPFLRQPHGFVFRDARQTGRSRLDRYTEIWFSVSATIDITSFELAIHRPIITALPATRMVSDGDKTPTRL